MKTSSLFKNEFVNNLFCNGPIMSQKLENREDKWFFSKFKSAKWNYQKPQEKFLKLFLYYMPCSFPVRSWVPIFFHFTFGWFQIFSNIVEIIFLLHHLHSFRILKKAIILFLSLISSVNMQPLYSHILSKCFPNGGISSAYIR